MPGFGVNVVHKKLSWCQFSIKASKFSRSSSAVTQPASMSTLSGETFFLDSFALRQWDDPNYGGTRVSYDKEQFLSRVHELFKAQGSALADGYAPFCKHIFVENFVGAKLGALKITESNRSKLNSGYTKRRPEELAVLTRWFRCSDVEVPVAKYLDLILYSREQLVKEYEAMPVGKGRPEDLPNVPWGIISIKAQDEPFETPMQPITMLRNSLGKQEGGSGVSLDREAYEKSVQYWEEHATIVDGAKPNGE
ncbi:hypothetical protein CEUSTIGMA_g7356.t1 [Chlamydomonas eustigma]|uniref:Flagellar associated protein n=1 Tax=Chlamydomonas eustigma TaxID=1157962 RepID=A0A250XA46_9CHLO|nr:hypothetical protein CEUSTIGMA_g7356.t1 [Chlamydomonas eustigma]|eukprot:GAX79916.1 hypothetical protein CEUSTIGMA_g7356.t1 [Chlamydomonas eustigma]